MTGEWWDNNPAIIPGAPASPAVVPPPSDSTVPTGVTNTEPVILGGSFMGVVSATLAVLVEFDVWNPTERQFSLSLVLLTSLITFVTVLVRGKATSPATVAKIRNGQA